MKVETPKRGKWKWDNDKKCLVDYEEPVVDVNAPYIITDEIPGGIKSMADREMYTSKRKLRDAYRRKGFIEVGNDESHLEAKEQDPKERERREEAVREDVEKAYYQVRDNMAPLSELDKEKCKIINRQVREGHDNREYDDYGNVRD